MKAALNGDRGGSLRRAQVAANECWVRRLLLPRAGAGIKGPGIDFNEGTAMAHRRSLLGFTVAFATAIGVSHFASGQAPASGPSAPAPKPTGVARIQADAAELLPMFKTEAARRFLQATEALPPIEPRKVMVNNSTRAWLTPEEAAALPEETRSGLTERILDEQFYYNTGYGSPLVYARVLELAALAQQTPEAPFPWTRVMDFGYGTIGQLRLMASLGCLATGVDVDSKLAMLYREPGDQGSVPPSKASAAARAGAVRPVTGRWPAESAAIEAVRAAGNAAPGADSAAPGFDLITSKNTLKMGYIHPSREAEKRLLVDLGVDDQTFVKAVFDALTPGGLFVIYNLSPRLSRDDEPYRPWSDGRCPFPRELLERAGFQVLAFDQDDNEAARAIFTTLEYPVKNAAGEDDLFALYTIARKSR